ncbi:hypothetical protein ACN28S_45155 [Cystobacter fuscus]
MLVYAPDGFVYRIPTEVWTHVPKKKHKHKQHDHHVTRYEPGHLPDSVKNMLNNEVTLANVPNHSTAVIPPSKPGDRSASDNITCFLLNLNSIMMSYSPKQPRIPLYNIPDLRPSPEAPEPGPSKPAARKPRKAAPRRKR